MTYKQQLLKLAKEYNIIVEYTNSRYHTVELLAPDGHCFDSELHFLVNEGGPGESAESVFKSALDDVKWYGKRLSKCPDDCPCKEI